MKIIKLKVAQSLFPETLSRCCAATTKCGICLNCGRETPMPFYLWSDKPIPDEVALDYERRLRPHLPISAQLVLYVNPLKI
jgi:hypothetical protein